MFLSLTLCCILQEPAAPTADELREHVKVLASDTLEGRRAGEPGDRAAAYYIAGAMAAAGLQPAGENGSWFQNFEIELPPRAGKCSLVVKHGPRRMVWPAGTLALSASATTKGKLVDAHYGMVLESHGMNEYREAGVEGHIAMVRRYSEFGIAPENPAFAQLGNLRDKVRNAAKAGATAVVLGTHPIDVAKGGSGELLFDAVPGSMPIPVVTVNPENFQTLQKLLREGAVSVEVQAEVIRPKAMTQNVLGVLTPNGSHSSNEAIVLGGHYDHLGFGGEGSLAPGELAIHNGADDNASGTAVLLELAEAMAQSSAARPRPVVFAFWGAEELGLLGSKYWVKNPTGNFDAILANINLDMVGRLQDGHVTVGSYETAAAFGRALEHVALHQEEGLPELMFRPVGGKLPGGGGSDHMSFHQEEIPAMFLFSGLHTDYHKPSDDWQLLDYERMQVLTLRLQKMTEFLVAQVPAAELVYIKPQQEEDPHKGTRIQGARAWFGSIPDYGASPVGGGMQLAGTSPGGPAEKAGLKKGDVIKKMGDMEVVDIYDFMDALAKYKVGQTIPVHIVRGDAELTLPVTLSTRGGGQ